MIGYGFVGTAGVKHYDFGTAKSNDVTGENFFVGNALAINKATRRGIVVPKKVFIILLNQFCVNGVYAGLCDYQVVLKCTADVIALFDHPERWETIILEVKFQHG